MGLILFLVVELLIFVLPDANQPNHHRPNSFTVSAESPLQQPAIIPFTRNSALPTKLNIIAGSLSQQIPGRSDTQQSLLRRTLRYISLFFLFYISLSSTSAQTIGGSTVYNFLNLPNTPQLTALGGVNISNISNDIGLSFNNPSLLRPSMHTQLNASFNSMYGGIRNYSLTGGYYSQQWQTSFAIGANYFDYGTIPQTDASGNILGDFHPTDYVTQLIASRRYEKKWFYGATFKFIHSGYGIYRSSGIALDAGFAFYDSAHFLQIAFTAKMICGCAIERHMRREQNPVICRSICNWELPSDSQRRRCNFHSLCITCSNSIFVIMIPLLITPMDMSRIIQAVDLQWIN